MTLSIEDSFISLVRSARAGSFSTNSRFLARSLLLLEGLAFWAISERLGTEEQGYD